MEECSAHEHRGVQAGERKPWVPLPMVVGSPVLLPLAHPRRHEEQLDAVAGRGVMLQLLPLAAHLPGEGGGGGAEGGRGR